MSREEFFQVKTEIASGAGIPGNDLLEEVVIKYFNCPLRKVLRSFRKNPVEFFK